MADDRSEAGALGWGSRGSALLGEDVLTMLDDGLVDGQC